MAATLRDRLLSPRVARAITSPSAILLAGAGAAVGILAGLPLAAAAAVGAVAYGGKVALAVPKAPVTDDIQPDRLGEPWRSAVHEAQDARARYAKAAATAADGPLRARLTEIGERVDAGVRACWRIAQRGDVLEAGLRSLDAEDVRRQLAEVEAAGDGGWGASGNRDQAVAALRAQLASSDRIAAVAHDARDRLRVLNARLDEAVARAVELALGADDARALGGLGSDVDAVVTEMEALRQALEETGQRS